MELSTRVVALRFYLFDPWATVGMAGFNLSEAWILFLIKMGL